MLLIDLKSFDSNLAGVGERRPGSELSRRRLFEMMLAKSIV
jgi:hypothetical protein